MGFQTATAFVTRGERRTAGKRGGSSIKRKAMAGTHGASREFGGRCTVVHVLTSTSEPGVERPWIAMIMRPWIHHRFRVRQSANHLCRSGAVS